MKRIRHTLALLPKLSKGFFPLMTVGLSVPVLVLVGFGVYAILTQGYLLYFAGILAVSSMFIYLPMLLIRKQVTSAPIEQDSDFVSPSSDWSDAELAIWQVLDKDIDRLQQERSDWRALKPQALELIERTAQQFGRQELQFSVIDALKMSEEVSRRYRQILKHHVPFVESVKVSHLNYLFENNEKIEKGSNALGTAWNVGSQMWRVARLSNPMAALALEVRGQVMGRLLPEVADNIQAGLKKALLQEVVSVAIDLYSGRFGGDGIESSNSTRQDKKHKAPLLEPLRVAIVGQVGGGKSSLMNALKSDMVAEVDVLPSTAEASSYDCSMGQDNVMNIVDLPGIDGDSENVQALLEEATRSDMLLWVLKANQSARQLDTEFYEKIQNYFHQDKNKFRKWPVMVGVLSQVDKLKPLNDWSPPYDLSRGDSAKEKMINAALAYNRQLFGFDALVPLSISEHKAEFNLDGVKQQIVDHYNQGIQVQLNRRRLGGGDVGVSAQVERLRQGGKALFGMATKGGVVRKRGQV